MGVIYLARHAQASFGADDYDRLSPLGERQAKLLGTVLRERGIIPEIVVTGSLRRQRESARLLMVAGGYGAVPVEVDDGYNEYDHEALLDRPEYADRLARVRASAEGERPDLYQALLDDSTESWIERSEQPPDGHDPETFRAFRCRVTATLEGTASHLSRGGSAVVVTSGGVIAILATVLTDAPTSSWMKLMPVIVNTGISKIITGRRGVSLVSLNEHAHLEGAHADLFSYR